MEKELKFENLDKRKISKKKVAKKAKNFCDGATLKLSQTAPSYTEIFDGGKILYINPTESLIMGDFVKAGSTCATVLAGGDFAFDAIYHGAREILTFDINNYQQYMAGLKLAALQQLNYSQYYQFFSNIGDRTFLSRSIYEQIKKSSCEDENLFTFLDIYFQKLESARKNARYTYEKLKKDYDDVNFRGILFSSIFKTIESELYTYDTDVYLNYLLSQYLLGYKSPKVLESLSGLEMISTNGSYAESAKSFNKTREMLDGVKIKYVNSDITNLFNKLQGIGYLDDSSFKGFDSIYLSNIPEYIGGDTFAEVVDRELMPLLKDSGEVVYCCQGVGQKMFSLNISDLNDIKKNAHTIETTVTNPYIHYQLINDIEGYSHLKDKYDISFSEVDTLGVGNGFDDKDTFVYVRKK